MTTEILRPGRTEWESGHDLGGLVPLADVVGSLVRYRAGVAPDGGPAYIVCRVAGLSEPDQHGTRSLQMVINTPEGGSDA